MECRTVVLAATPFSGCDVPRPPAEVVEPTTIGVVESITHSARGRIVLVALSTGFSLPLADPNDEQWRQGEFVDNLGHHFCLDEAGQVVSRP